MENIKIIDNILSKEELNEIITIFNDIKLSSNFRSGTNEKFDNRNFAIKNMDFIFNKYVKEKIEKIFLKKFLFHYQIIQKIGVNRETLIYHYSFLIDHNFV